MKMTFARSVIASVLILGLLNGCAAEPTSDSAKANLADEVQTARARFQREDPDLKALLDRAPGYAMFPAIGKAGLVAGGAYGRGQLFEHGSVTGFASLTQASFGLQAGAEDYAELVVFGERSAVDKFKTGKLEFDANASAIILKAGAARSASFRDGVTVFAEPNGGAMVELSLSGQKLQYAPTEDGVK